MLLLLSLSTWMLPMLALMFESEAEWGGSCDLLSRLLRRSNTFHLSWPVDVWFSVVEVSITGKLVVVWNMHSVVEPARGLSNMTWYQHQRGQAAFSLKDWDVSLKPITDEGPTPLPPDVGPSTRFCSLLGVSILSSARGSVFKPLKLPLKGVSPTIL